jgi:hypothetical protein
MEEQLILFDTAKLAKEKGFNEKVINHYGSGYTPCLNDNGIFMDDVCNSEIDPYEFSAPTQSVLQRWLRDEHNIDVWSQPFVRNQSLPDESYSYFIYKDGDWVNDGCDCLDFEEALEKGLIESLKLIS